MPGQVANWLVVIFDASGEPAETHWHHIEGEANDDVRDSKAAGCSWVKKYRITSPVVPYGDSR